MKDFDLNLLRVLAALDQTRHVGRAAEALGMSQSGFSTALQRLRANLGDDLFVRVGGGMQPTPRARTMVESARHILQQVDTDILGSTAFDASAADQDFRLAMSDVAEVVFVPPLLRHLTTAAPKIRIHVVSTGTIDLREALANGSVDLAIGYLPGLERDAYFRQAMTQHTYACMVRRDHPRARPGQPLDRRTYESLGHAVVANPARSTALLEQALTRHRLHRSIHFSTPHHLSLAAIVSATDLIATVPLGTALDFARSHSVNVLPLPFDPPHFTIHQYWHRRTHRSAAHRWLREQLRTLFNGTTDPYRDEAERLYGARHAHTPAEPH